MSTNFTEPKHFEYGAFRATHRLAGPQNATLSTSGALRSPPAGKSSKTSRQHGTHRHPGPDPINDAAVPAWRIVDPRRIGALVVTAAEDVDALIAAVPAESVDAVLAEGRPRLLDRSRHRELHVATIEARLRV